MRNIILWVAVVLWLLILPACGGADEETADTAAVTGNITYLQGIALPDDARVHIAIQNASLAGAPPDVSVIGEQVINAPGQVPIAFATPYEATAVEENATYLLYARIEDAAGNLLFLNAQGVPVITHGSPTENVEVVVEQRGGTVPEQLPTPGGETAVTGRAAFAEAVTLPAGSTARIMIQNASLADAPPEVALLAEQFIPNPGQFPIPFAVTYNQADVQEAAMYRLYVRIEDNEGNLLYLNTQGRPVITQGNPTTDIEVLVEQITPAEPPAETATELPATAVPPAGGSSNAATAAAEGLTFRLVQFGPPGFERDVIPGTEITVQFTATEISGFAGCNSYSAAVVPVADYFVFGPIVSTRQTCSMPEGIMKQEQDYLSALQGTRGYQYQWASDGSNRILGLQLLYPLATGGNGALTYITQ